MSMLPALDAPRVDGRVLRGERTRERIVRAMIELIKEGQAAPRSVDIAQRAQVSVRSIFQHFADFRELYLAVADRVVQDLVPVIAAVPSDGPFGKRLEAFVGQRVTLCEAVAPLSRAATMYDADSSGAQERMRTGRQFGRYRIEQVFEAELKALDEKTRRERVDAVALVSDWDYWDVLRRVIGLDAASAQHVMMRSVRALLTEPAH